MFHSGMGIVPYLIMGLIISSVIGVGTEDIKGFVFPMALFSIAAVSDLISEKKDLENENKELRRKNQQNFYEPKTKRMTKKRKKLIKKLDKF